MFVEKIVNKNVMPWGWGQSRQQDVEADQSAKTTEGAGPAIPVKDSLEHNPFHWLLLVRRFNRKRGRTQGHRNFSFLK